MNQINHGIPYCAGCGRKVKRQDLKAGEYFCPIVEHLPLKGIVRGDTDGKDCVDAGVYLPISRSNEQN